jgi:DNA-binding NarL/FixJ family response regulator
MVDVFRRRRAGGGPPVPPLSESMRITVLIVDDHRVLAELLAEALAGAEDVAVLATVGTAAEAVAAARSGRPDVVILDYDLPDVEGTAGLEAIRKAVPLTRVLVLTSYSSPVVLKEMMDAGANGFVTKRNGSAEILAAVRAVAADETPVSADMVRSVLGPATGSSGADLTERELQVLRIASEGRSNKAIAEELNLSVNTVRNHMQHVLTKLGAHSKLEATAIGARLGLLRR